VARRTNPLKVMAANRLVTIREKARVVVRQSGGLTREGMTHATVVANIWHAAMGQFCVGACNLPTRNGRAVELHQSGHYAEGDRGYRRFL